MGVAMPKRGLRWFQAHFIATLLKNQLNQKFIAKKSLGLRGLR